MPDKPIFGGPPPAGAQPIGALWLEVIQMASDSSGRTVTLNAYTWQKPYAVDWGDGTWSGNPADWTVTTAPAGAVPGKYTATHVYTAAFTGVRGYVEAGVRAHMHFGVGNIKVSDPNELLGRPLTQQQLQKRARDRDLGDTAKSDWYVTEGRVN